MNPTIFREGSGFLGSIWVFLKSYGIPKSSHSSRAFHYFHHPFWGYIPLFLVQHPYKVQDELEVNSEFRNPFRRGPFRDFFSVLELLMVRQPEIRRILSPVEVGSWVETPLKKRSGFSTVARWLSLRFLVAKTTASKDFNSIFSVSTPGKMVGEMVSNFDTLTPFDTIHGSEKTNARHLQLQTGGEYLTGWRLTTLCVCVFLMFKSNIKNTHRIHGTGIFTYIYSWCLM